LYSTSIKVLNILSYFYTCTKLKSITKVKSFLTKNYFPGCPRAVACSIPCIIKYVPIANSANIINGAYF